MKITLWDWRLCLYMTFTALLFISASWSQSRLLSRLPSIIPRRSESGGGGGGGGGSGRGGGNLLALTNEVSWDRQPMWARMFHGDSEKGGKGAEARVWSPGGTFMLHNCSLPLGCNARRIPRSPFHVTRQRDSHSFIDEVIPWVRFKKNAS